MEGKTFILAFDGGIRNFGIAAVEYPTGNSILYQGTLIPDGAPKNLKIPKDQLYDYITNFLAAFDANTGLITHATAFILEGAWPGKAKGVATDMFVCGNVINTYLKLVRPNANRATVKPAVIKSYFGFPTKLSRAQRKKLVVQMAGYSMTHLGTNPVPLAYISEKKEKRDDCCDAYLLALYYWAKSMYQSDVVDKSAKKLKDGDNRFLGYISGQLNPEEKPKRGSQK